jgi:hypothetical protein
VGRACRSPATHSNTYSNRYGHLSGSEYTVHVGQWLYYGVIYHRAEEGNFEETLTSLGGISESCLARWRRSRQNRQFRRRVASVFSFEHDAQLNLGTLFIDGMHFRLYFVR